MEKSIRILATHVGSQIDLKSVRSTHASEPRVANDFQLLYGTGERLQHLTRYGVVALSAHAEGEVQAAVQKIQSAIVNSVPTRQAELEIVVQPGVRPHIAGGRVVVDRLDESVIHSCMDALGQSIALDYFHSIAQSLLKDLQIFSNNMHRDGKLKVNRKDLLRFMGRSMNIQNEIAGNIFVFKNDELTDKGADLQQALRQHFNLATRVREIEYAQRTIEDNLKIFLQISNQRESNVLEWIIIILILMEILNVFIPKFFNG